jgi:VanZ family protein
LYDLERDFTVQLTAIAVIVLISLGAAVLVRDRASWRFGLDPAASCLAIGSALAILVGTVSRRGDGRARGGIQLVPLKTLRSYHYDKWDLLIYLVGNVALFIPLGFFFYLSLRHLAFRRRVAITTGLCAVVSIGVEILQLPIWTRSSDVDDVLTNTSGGFLGALAGFVLLHLVRALWMTGDRPIRHYAEGSRAS